jgi:hypothetical protein
MEETPLSLYDFSLFDRRRSFGLLLFLSLWLSSRNETEDLVKAVRLIYSRKIASTVIDNSEP